MIMARPQRWLTGLLAFLMSQCPNLCQSQRVFADAYHESPSGQAATAETAIPKEFPLIVEVSKSQYYNPFERHG